MILNLISFILDTVLPHDPVRRLRALGLWVAGFSIFALGFAYTAQYGFGLQPCILCLYQRWPYRLVIFLGLLAALLTTSAKGVDISKILLWTCAALFIVDASIALFQVGVEEHWWRGTEKCVGTALDGLNAADMLAQIKAAPLVRCDDVQFRFLGLTMAAYNGLFALGLAAGTALSLVLRPRRR